jgi:hypothetical protein
VRTLTTLRDGILTITLRRASTGTTLSLAEPEDDVLVAPRTHSLTYTVCGSRTLRLTVISPVAGEITATISAP